MEPGTYNQGELKVAREKKEKKQILSDDARNELDGMSAESLNKVIADASQAIQTATKERDANEHYQAAKLAVTDLSAGLRDVKKYQGAKIGYSLNRLRELRGEDTGE